jgi:hypothetical protein
MLKSVEVTNEAVVLLVEEFPRRMLQKKNAEGLEFAFEPEVGMVPIVEPEVLIVRP